MFAVHVFRLLIISLTIFCCQVRGQSKGSLHEPITMLFLGNSITYEGIYVSDIDCYFRLKYPERKIVIINAGLPSETVSGLSEHGHAGNRFPRPDLHERLHRVLALAKPDVVFASYGINDGIYLPFDENRLTAYQTGIRWLHDEVVKAGAKPIHITGAYYDELRGRSAGYEATMDRYADWLMSMKDSVNWKVIDVYHPMKKYLYAHREVDKQFHLDGFELAEDGVHPDANAHWLIAREILLQYGEHSVANIPSIEKFAGEYAHGLKVLELVRQKHALMKDAWLTATGHKRPEMKTGLPMKEAQEKARSIDQEIDALIKSTLNN